CQLQCHGILTTARSSRDVIIVSGCRVSLAITVPNKWSAICHQGIFLRSVCNCQLQCHRILTATSCSCDVIVISSSTVSLAITIPNKRSAIGNEGIFLRSSCNGQLQCHSILTT